MTYKLNTIFDDNILQLCPEHYRTKIISIRQHTAFYEFLCNLICMQLTITVYTIKYMTQTYTYTKRKFACNRWLLMCAIYNTTYLIYSTLSLIKFIMY